MIETNGMKVDYNMTVSVSYEFLRNSRHHIEFRPLDNNMLLLDVNGELWLRIATDGNQITYGKVIENPNFAVKH